MKRRIAAVLLVSAMAVTMITACGSKEAETETESTATEEQAEDTQDGEFQFVSAADTVKAAGGDTHILDVREWANYSQGRVANSEWCPIFPLEDESLVEAMTTYAEEKLSDGKDIYIICNSGKRGAEKATGVLKDAGIDAELIYTVEGGAEDADVAAAFVK